MSTTMPISGLNAEPASLPSPASDARCRVCLRGWLQSCRLNFALTGLSPVSSPIRSLKIFFFSYLFTVPGIPSPIRSLRFSFSCLFTVPGIHEGSPAG